MNVSGFLHLYDEMSRESQALCTHADIAPTIQRAADVRDTGGFSLYLELLHILVNTAGVPLDCLTPSGLLGRGWVFFW